MLPFQSIIILIVFLSLTIAHANEQTSQQRYTVAFAQDTLSNDWRLAQVKQFQKAFSQYPNIDFIYSNADGDAAQQFVDVKNFYHQNVDVIITSPRNAAMMTPIVEEIVSKTPVVLVTRTINSEKFTAIIRPDDYKIASEAAHVLAKKMGNSGNIVMLTGIPTASTAIKRKQGFIDTIKNHYPDIKITAIKNGNYLRSDAIIAINEIIAKKIDFDAIYAHSDSMASGARMALKHAGINVKSKLIVGIDYINEAKDAIINDEQYASFLYPTCAQEASEVVIKILNKKPYQKETIVKSEAITKENVHQIDPIF
ncbi:MAG: substrate-binding domain-containing protein [Gammaproteobacteria bacterium]|nr:substrate-binding domain-containing protein [Gammaproteobacteria bacterium]